MRLHFQVQGEGSPLLILHGLLGSLDNWRSMADRLAALCRVYSVDLRNHGRSPHSPAMNYSEMANDLQDLCAAEHLRPAVVLGHSMGGKVAMQFATAHPDRLEKLIVADIAPRAYPASHRALLSAMRQLDLQAYDSFSAVGEALAPAIADAAMRQFVLKNLRRADDGRFFWRIGLEEIEQNYDALTDALDVSMPFRGPTLFLRGQLSGYIKDEDLAGIRSGFPRAEVKTIWSAGHWIHVDAPDDFYAAVAQFLAD